MIMITTVDGSIQHVYLYVQPYAYRMCDISSCEYRIALLLRTIVLFFRFVIVHRRSLSFNSCYDTQVRSWCSLHIYIPHVHRSSIVWRSISRQRNGAILRGEQLSKMFMFIAHKLITILVNIHDVHCPISFHILVISYMRAATIEHDFIAFNQHL